VDVISEMPALWRLWVRHWSRLNRSHRRTVDGARAPSRNDEYLLYQTLVGSLPSGPLDAEALQAYTRRVDQAMLKSVRESKVVTSWMNPNAAYESALSGFIESLLSPRENNLFLADLQTRVTPMAWYGALNSVTLATLKSLSPGVPDFYQGHEGIELSLVDPDNRRPVDYGLRRDWLAQAQALAAAPDRAATLAIWLTQAVDGRAKFWAIWRTLQLRQAWHAMLLQAEYLPLEVRGERAPHVVAYARRNGPQWLVVVAARLYASLGLQPDELPLGERWGDTEVVWPAAEAAPAAMEDAIGGRRHAVTDGALRLRELLCDFPSAALAGTAEAGT
jgi:(1->4)-alpha-D-glucan 1-alpha-D-glucosylmutase